MIAHTSPNSPATAHVRSSRGQIVKKENALANARSLLIERRLSRSASSEKIFIVKEGRLQSLTSWELKWPDRRSFNIAEDRWNWLHIDYCNDYSH